jgi:cytochrome c oxidase subunit II
MFMHRSLRHAAVALYAMLPAMPVLARPQSAVHPQGRAAQLIAESWWLMLWGAVAIFIVVMALALYAMFRVPEKRWRASERALIVGGGVVFPVLTLSALLVYGTGLGRDLTLQRPAAVQVEVVGRQFWWEVRYPESGVVTANEIHIPTGRVVAVTVRTDDVIHSFSVPALAGKIDLIPGQPNRIQLQADASGIFRGQCAEFCGAQHARMAFYVEATDDVNYRQWIERQRQPAIEPAGEQQRRGLAAFLAAECQECHTIRGTPARGSGGPDLTHVASRRYLAAGTLENNGDNLARWIAHNQRFKPGARMPEFEHLPPATLRDIVAYLESLQ